MPVNVISTATKSLIDGVQNESSRTLLTAICDRCKKSISWTQEQIQKDEATLPDDFFRLVVVEVNQPVEGQALPNAKKLVFCGKRCTKQYFDFDYVPVLSPREFVQQQEENNRANLANTPHPEPLSGETKPEYEARMSGMPSVEIPAVGAISQADGIGSTQ